jgi:hypothetical protein
MPDDIQGFVLEAKCIPPLEALCADLSCRSVPFVTAGPLPLFTLSLLRQSSKGRFSTDARPATTVETTNRSISPWSRYKSRTGGTTAYGFHERPAAVNRKISRVHSGGSRKGGWPLLRGEPLSLRRGGNPPAPAFLEETGKGYQQRFASSLPQARIFPSPLSSQPPLALLPFALSVRSCPPRCCLGFSLSKRVLPSLVRGLNVSWAEEFVPPYARSHPNSAVCC